MRGQTVGMVGLVVTMALGPSLCFAQEPNGARRVGGQAVDAPSWAVPPPLSSDATPRAVRRLLDEWEPLQQRLIQSDQLRVISGLMALGILAYEGMNTSPLPVDAIGTEALRIGLHPQLNSVRDRTGYTVEPSVGRRRFVLTFRKILD